MSPIAVDAASMIHDLAIILDRTTDRSSLAIFDAQAMAKGPVAELQLPVRVPIGFHGLWLDEAEL